MSQLAGFSDLKIENFRGLLTTPKPQDCPPDYSPGPCRNAMFTPGGTGSRPGTHTRITLGGGTDIFRQELVFQASPFQKYYLYLMEDHKLYYSTGGTRTLLLSSPPLTAQTTHFRATQYGNFIYLFFSDGFAGTTAMYVWSPANATIDLATILPEASIGAFAAVDGGPTPDGLTPGLHKLKMVFETRTGFRSKPTDWTLEYTAPGGVEISLTGIPLYIGDANHVAAECVKRHIVMTEASLETYYIANTIEDNTTTTAIFAVLDEQLVQETDVSDYFQFMSPLPGVMSGIMYHNRLTMCGNGDSSSIGYISEIDSPQSFRGDIGFLEVRRDDGQRLITPFVARNTLYWAKERAIFAYQDNGEPPHDWQQELVTDNLGTQSIYGVSKLSAEGFVIIQDAKGPFRFDGSPQQRISDQIFGKAGIMDRPTWANIRFDAMHWGEVHVDELLKRIYNLVPTGNSDRANKLFVCDYLSGWGELRWSDWSTNDDQWRSLIVDGAEVLAAVAGPNVQIFDDDDSDDDDTAIDYANRIGLVEPRPDGINLFAGIGMHAVGSGTLRLKVYDADLNFIVEPNGFCLEAAPGYDLYRGLLSVREERISVEFSHNSLGAKSSISRMIVYAKPDGMRVHGSEPCLEQECVGGIPRITGLSPTSAAAGGPGFTLTVTGINFVPGSVVIFNGQPRVTTFISATQLQAAILAEDIATSGTFNVVVSN